jgi:L-lactate dehydrogenase complex protein LldG
MESKQSILKAVAGSSGGAVELPGLDDFGIRYDDPHAQFAEVLAAVGGTAIRVADDAALESELQQLDVVRDAGKVFSRVPGVASTVDLDDVETPHELNGLDLTILPGELAVAENAAVWVSGGGLKHRAVYFIAEHLILVVNAGNLVHNMHQAYERLRFGEAGYGVFISGPSKTADIEQSLVIGAQGPRSLHVFLRG